MNYHDADQPQNNDNLTFSGNSGDFKPQKGTKLWVIALCCGILGGLLGGGGILLLRNTATPPSAADYGSAISGFLEGKRETSVIDITSIDTNQIMSAAEVYAANVNSTVGITTSVTTNFWGYQSTSAASGSGFIISHDGYILTNYHVIASSERITVSLYNGNSHDAKLIGFDESNDIAVLKIDTADLTPVIWGDSDNTNVGDSVIAIGNPLGELTFSLTAGAISAKDREVTFSNRAVMKLIQTDCAINSGNSGGALFNMYGEVIGVTNAKYSGASASGATIDNIAFAIPVNSIRRIVEDIIEKGYFAKPYLGVSVIDVSENHQIYGLPRGAAVQAVTTGSPAEKAGLNVGDIITKADAKQISSGNDLVSYIQTKQAGDTVNLTVYRRGQSLQITATIEEKIQNTMP